MRLEGQDGVCELSWTIIGYEAPEDVSERETSDWRTTNWLEAVIRVRTPHGWGVSQVACTQTWDAARFADWLDNVSRRRICITGIAFPEPNLALRAVAFLTQHVRLHVEFILEQPGEWHMDNAPNQVSNDYYIGEISMNVSRASLRTAAESLRAELKHFPPR